MLNKQPINNPFYMVSVPSQFPQTAGPLIDGTLMQGLSISVTITDASLALVGEVVLQGGVGQIDSLVFLDIVVLPVISGAFTDGLNTAIIDATTTQIPYLRLLVRNNNATVGATITAKTYQKPL